ncbi:MAG: glycoside hydrolase family 5 protein [Bacteroidetes bacterium]|nr:glycoside hydrolase family 5 protein [Bacteroidota bacterium]
MKKPKLISLLISLLFIFLATTTFAQTKPISLHPENPHYFSYKGKPTVLITSGEHYGAVMNTDFNYKIYLKTLQKDGLNMTRTMTGGYFEPEGAFKIAKNTLAPSPEKFIGPWARAVDGKKFDLEQWDEAYFARLEAFLTEAQKRGVIVELDLFCQFYGEMQWNLSPFNIRNNVNNLGDIPHTDVYTLDKNKGLLAVQEKMVRKIVDELKIFPNLIYEICNEPGSGTTLEWQEYISKVITDAEKSFAHKHLISQNIVNGQKKIENPNPLISVFNFHYASPPKAVTINYNLNKVIGENETGFKGQKDSTYRKQAWELILAGGGLFNNLDYSFTTEHPNGTFRYPSNQPGGGSSRLREQLSYLKKFVESFNFIALKPDNSIYAGGLLKGLTPYILAETGKQYAFYLMGGKQVNPELNLPKGNYSLEWLNPLTGKIEKKEKLSHSGGKVKLTSPEYTEDIALKILRINR